MVRSKRRVKLFIHLFAIIIIAIMSTCANAVEYMDCGGARVLIELPEKDQPNFLLILSSRARSLRLAYPDQNEFLMARCQKNGAGHEMIVINHHCGGSGCTESNWGIIDPADLTIKLTAGRPDGSRLKGNHDKAEKIIGVPLTPFICKTYNGRQQNGDYCFVSPIQRH